VNSGARTFLAAGNRKEISMKPRTKAPIVPVRLFLLAGFAGGVAEVIWVGLYSLIAPLSAVEVARQVTASVVPAAAALPLAPALGLAIHLVLSLLLGIAFGMSAWLPFARRLGAAGAMAAAVTGLVAVWAVNFFVVLPGLNPTFVALMPLEVTLLSKTLFGVAMGWVLQRGNARTASTGRFGVEHWRTA
jgi:hypothetical protein